MLKQWHLSKCYKYETDRKALKSNKLQCKNIIVTNEKHDIMVYNEVKRWDESIGEVSEANLPHQIQTEMVLDVSS